MHKPSSAFGHLENGNHMTKHMSLKLSSNAASVTSNPDKSLAGCGAGGIFKHDNRDYPGTHFATIKPKNMVEQISNNTRERWRQTTRNIKVRNSFRIQFRWFELIINTKQNVNKSTTDK